MKERVPTERIIACLRETNGLVSLAAKRVPCSPSTIHERRRRVKAVQQAIDEYREEIVDLGELALRSAVIEKEPWAVGFVLKTLGKGRGYGDSVALTGADGGALKIEYVNDWRETPIEQ
jgi:hypothetical protein